MKIPQLKTISPVQRASTDMDKKKKISKSPIQRKENKTGMPDNLKSGIENLSGMDMGDVKVHYNSTKPQQLQAHAYAQGTDIHIAPGQERHLPHEAWHVVQQKQGRVKPTMQMKKTGINNDVGLEQEADRMGKSALQAKATDGFCAPTLYEGNPLQIKPLTGGSVAQLAPAEVETAIYETMGGGFAADDGIAFLYINQGLISQALVPKPKGEVVDEYGGGRHITSRDGEVYLLSGMARDVFGAVNTLKGRVDANARQEEVTKTVWGKESKSMVTVKTPETFNIAVEVVGSAGACNHCKVRLASFKDRANRIQAGLKRDRYITEGSSNKINYHYVTRNKQTGPGPGGEYGWADAQKKTGQIGRHTNARNTNEYSWWKKSIQ
jgi:hypothetical protein